MALPSGDADMIHIGELTQHGERKWFSSHIPGSLVKLMIFYD